MNMTERELEQDETVSLISSDKVAGTAVYGADREHIGQIEKLMIDKRGGRVAYAVLSFGGFLGIGEHHHPLPWETLTYDEDVDGYVVSLTRSQMEGGPSYPRDEEPDLNSPLWADGIGDYYRRTIMVPPLL